VEVEKRHLADLVDFQIRQLLLRKQLLHWQNWTCQKYTKRQRKKHHMSQIKQLISAGINVMIIFCRFFKISCI
jgi:hypothetical protein